MFIHNILTNELQIGSTSPSVRLVDDKGEFYDKQDFLIECYMDLSLCKQLLSFDCVQTITDERWLTAIDVESAARYAQMK